MQRVGGPYIENVEKATTLYRGCLGKAIVINRIGGQEFTPIVGYLVPNVVPTLHIDRADDVEKAHVRKIARWIELLPAEARFLHAWSEKERMVVEACTYHTKLLDAEIETLVRGNCVMYRMRGGGRVIA